MATEQRHLSLAEYQRMAKELDSMAEIIRGHPEMNYHFAERLTLMARQMREDAMRTHPSATMAQT